MDDYRQDQARLIPQMKGRVDFTERGSVYFDARDEAWRYGLLFK